jgi:general nucleoside transport system ATP-binding protein
MTNPAITADGPPLLRIAGITKHFGALTANDNISFDLRRGEVLALLGENGAGKSTLVSILFGHYRADAGHIQIDGKPLPPGDTQAALQAGIGMVHQHFTLADNLSVLDNVLIGAEPLWQPFTRRAQARARLLETSRRYGLQVNPDARVGELSIGERQRVEILKVLVPIGRRGGARLLILDEPTAVLTPQESQALFATLKQLVAQGLAVIFISHKLDEVLQIAQRIVVLRGGRSVAQLPAAGATKAQLAQAMVGRSVPEPARRTQLAAPDVVCSLREVTVLGRGARPLLDRVSLDLRAGEVVAVAGVAGNGQQALAELLHGLIAPDSGQLTVNGAVLPPQPRAWLRAGVARIPEDRHAVGVVGDLPLWENAVLERQADAPFARRGLVQRGAARAFAERLVKRFDVRGTEAAGVGTTTRALSGGNMQKLILGRALMGVSAITDDEQKTRPRKARLIVADQPTWGLDIGAVAFVHQQLLDACAAGAALLLISEDLDEIFTLADRIAVMHQGSLGPARPAARWTLQAIGLAMAGGVAGEGGAGGGAGGVSGSAGGPTRGGAAPGANHAA